MMDVGALHDAGTGGDGVPPVARTASRPMEVPAVTDGVDGAGATARTRSPGAPPAHDAGRLRRRARQARDIGAALLAAVPARRRDHARRDPGKARLVRRAGADAGRIQALRLG
jgi:hypothetical protein